MRSLVLALRALRREWRSGELAVLWLSLSVAVAALCGVGFLVDRIGRAVAAQASEVLAADLRVEADTPIAAQEQAKAQSLKLASARLTTTLSAIFNGDTNQLADVRAVSSGYPLRGHLTDGGPAVRRRCADHADSAPVARRGRIPDWPRRSEPASAVSSPSARARCA